MRENNTNGHKIQDEGTGTGYGRRVTKPDKAQNARKKEEEYDSDAVRAEIKRKKKEAQRERQREEAQRKKRRTVAVRRTLVLVVTAAIMAAVLMFLTPVFNIKRVQVEGNEIVSTEELDARLSDIYGQNLFKLTKKSIRDRLSKLSYIEDIDVVKGIIPPTVRVKIKEAQPAGVLRLNGRDVVVDVGLKVLSDNGGFEARELPEIRGLGISKYSVGSVLASDNGEKDEIIRICFDIMNRVGILEKIDYIDVADTTDIMFGYDDRLDAECGTKLDLERKIRMFAACVTSSGLAPNVRGVFDLRTPGRAELNP